MEKTNAARLLSAASIAYELIPYEYTEDDLSATHVAQTLGEEVGRDFNTQDGRVISLSEFDRLVRPAF